MKWWSTHTSHPWAPVALSFTVQTEKTHPLHTLHKDTTYFTTQRLENTIFNNTCYTKISHRPHTVTTKDIKTYMRHIHISIVSRHPATRGNKKILCPPPPHISSSEETFPHLTHRTLVQHRKNKSHFVKSYLHTVNANSHPSPLFPRCNTNPHTKHNLFTYTHISTTL